MWAAKDSGEGMSWNRAMSYLQNYHAGGYTDWRMPTQDEMSGLYDASKPLHVATKLIQITDRNYLANVAPEPGRIGVIGTPGFSFVDGIKTSFMGADLKVLPVRSGK